MRKFRLKQKEMAQPGSRQSPAAEAIFTRLINGAKVCRHSGTQSVTSHSWLSPLFTHTEATEDAFQNVVCADFPDDFPQGVERQAKVLRYQLFRNETGLVAA